MTYLWELESKFLPGENIWKSFDGLNMNRSEREIYHLGCQLCELIGELSEMWPTAEQLSSHTMKISVSQFMV